jgi:predicted nucleic acid-binding protein
VLVDTSVWSLRFGAMLRATGAEKELRDLVAEGRVLMLGAIRQELLSGIRTAEQFKRLRERLRAFPDIPLTEADYEEAARCFNRCRSRGVQGSNTDFLVAP